MKTLKLFIFFSIIATASVKATVRTLNNNNPTPGQYSTFSLAQAASSNGDTIYVSGSPTSYGVQLLTKQLTIIGTGHNPDKQNPLVSTFSSISTNTTTSSGSKLIGLVLINGSQIAANNTLTYESCKFNTQGILVTTLPTTATLILNKCIFSINAITTGPFTGSISLTCNNCIFLAGLSLSGSYSLTGSVSNSLFLGSGSFAFNLNTFLVSNNIYYGTSPQIGGTNVSTTVTNNISYLTSNNNFNGTIMSGNIVNANPLFTVFVPTTFHYTDDYHLQAGSPGHLTGTDGKDIGLYGGIDGVNFHMGGDPAIPQIRQMNISTTTIPAGTPVNVNIISTRKQ